MHARVARCSGQPPALIERPGIRLASPTASMFQRCAYYVSLSSGALRMELTELEPQGPYRLIVDDADSRHIEYFAKSNDALQRWAEFDAVMRPNAAFTHPPDTRLFEVTAH
jgi:hypothetical protein